MLRTVRAFLSDVQWKTLAFYPDYLWKTYGHRVANPTELTTYNFMVTLPKNVMSVERLLEKARKEIGESTEWLEDSDYNRLTPRDIWTRMLRRLSGLDNYERRLLELEGRGPTAIVTSGLPNACALHKLFTAYAIGSTGIGSSTHLMQLADGGMLKLVSLARKLVTWHFGIEDLVLIALDI